MKNSKFRIFCFLLAFQITGIFFQAHGDHNHSSHSKPHSDLNLSVEEQNLLRSHFVELPGIVLKAENFQGIPINHAHAELYMYENQFILLNFWATWCSPCLKEMPDLEDLYQKLKEEGIVILAVSMGEGKEKIEKFLKKHPFTFPIIADPEMEISQLYGIQNLPATFLIDRDKTILGRALGPRAWSKSDLVEFFHNRIKGL